MSRRGNDLVRRYLGMAALSAVRCNPAVRALYRRVVARHPEHKAIAIGHAMRKLLHLAFALWKTDKPFDPGHYPWHDPGPAAGDETPGGEPSPRPGPAAADQTNQAAGHKPDSEPAQPVVTAACAGSVPPGGAAGEGAFIDFGHLKSQLPRARVLEHLGLSGRLCGSGPQRRGPCPIHRGDGRGRSFSVNLDEGVFHCFDRACGRQGDVIDLWAALHQQGLRAAALDLVETFGLEPAPGTEKRHG
jgi:hypothetical protein